MAVALAAGLLLTGFSIKPASILPPIAGVGLYTATAYCNAYIPRRQDATVVFILGSTAQLLLIAY